MFKLISLTVAGLLISSVAAAQQRNLAFIGDLESGVVRSSSQKQDGFYIRTLPTDQRGQEVLSGGSGGFGPDSNADTRVVRSDTVGSETVRPRRGEFFMRSALYYDKNYLGLNTDEGRDKPRSSLAISNPVHRFDYDVEGYLGFSIYVPRNYENETGTPGTRGAIQLLTVKEPTNASAGFFELEQRVDPGRSQAHWYFRFSTNPNSVKAAGSQRSEYDLGPVDDDRGMWTDFVIRFRENPFSVDTNPAARGIPGARNQLYPGNRGILQVWKAEGPVDQEGNRRMALRVDRVNQPVGLVPHAKDGRVVNFRIYKYGWKKNRTNVRGPIWFGFDEMRLGFANQQVSYADVEPSGGQPCGDSCMASDSDPRPPAGLQVD
jgi:hypothetical protein